MITKIFGENCKRAVVFDLLLSHPFSEYTKTDIKEITGIARGTLNTFIDELVEYEIIKPTKLIGNGQLYQLNLGSTVTQALNSFQNQLADIEFEKEMKENQEEDSIEPIRPFEEIVKRNIVTSKGYDDFSGTITEMWSVIEIVEYNPHSSREMTGVESFIFKTDSFGTEDYKNPLTITDNQKEIKIKA